MGVSLNGGTQKMDGLMENPIKNGWFGGTPIFLETSKYRFWS